jgi:hypothetical protein
MACEDKDVLLVATIDVKFPDNVVYRDSATRRFGNEVVRFDLPTVFLQNLTN